MCDNKVNMLQNRNVNEICIMIGPCKCIQSTDNISNLFSCPWLLDKQ